MDLRHQLATRLRSLVGSGQIDLSRPAGDDGLFGPGSPAWAVHGDFTAMMIGGVSALLLQMLHPRALAGVWDHSDWQHAPHGRLRRTAQFIAVTTFGSTAAADAIVARVRAIHDHVHGSLPDGTPYSANDPDLLTWVHTAEVDSFLRAHLAYKDPAMPPARQDAYLAQAATVAEMLGATDVPKSRAAVAAYFRQVRPELRFDARTRAVAAQLLATPTESRATAPAGQLMLRAGVELLPDWAQAMHGRSVPALARPAIRAGSRGMGQVLRWALAAR